MRKGLILLALSFAVGCGPSSVSIGENHPVSCDEYIKNGPRDGVCVELWATAWRGPGPDELAGGPMASIGGERLEIGEALQPVELMDADVVDEAGRATFLIEPPLRLYAKVEDPAFKTTYFISQLITSSWQALSRVAPLVTAEGWSLLHAAAGRSPDSATGVLIGNMERSYRGGFVATTHNSGPVGEVVYGNIGTPDPLATATDGDGAFYVFALPAGATTLTVTNGTETYEAELRIMPDAAHTIILHESDLVTF